MQQQAYIISYCSISNNRVSKNGEENFAATAENLQQFFIEAYRNLAIEYPKFYKMDNLSKLGFLTAEYLLKDLPADQQLSGNETALVLCSANASLDTDIKYFNTIEEGASPALFVYTLPNIVVGEICIRNKFKGQGACFVSDNFDAAFMEQYVNDLFSSGTKYCICGWVDVLNELYTCAFFLVSANAAGGLLFNETNMNRIFETV